MPRFRLTVRRLMLAVAVAALGIEGWIVWGRYSSCRDRAAMLKTHAAGLRRVAEKAPPGGVIRGLVIDHEDGRPPEVPTRESLIRWADHIAALAAHHERAARRPWLPIGPEPREAR